MAQWLRLHASNSGDVGSLSSQGTKVPHVCYTVRPKIKTKKKI